MIKVLIVDDSAVVRGFLKEVFSRDRNFQVVGTAPDPFVARDKIVKENPDVITLDVEMPRMDGVTFLKKLMQYYPIPVVILSSLTQKGAETTLQCFDEGAIDVIAKPHMDIIKGMESIQKEILEKVKIAASAKVKRNIVDTEKVAQTLKVSKSLKKSTHQVLAIGASTGGTEAIKVVLKSLPANTPGTVIVQHMPEKFTTAFAARLNDLSPMEVREAKDGDGVIPGLALIAPGSYHMRLKREGGRYYVKLDQSPPVHHQRPSVDVLFDSVAEYAGGNATGVILTGMGGDGAAGMLRMREQGAYTIAQDEASCVVFGMPKEAINRNAAIKIASPQDV
ncbi:MAG: chemotaxis response regulator protein-glutamate methylesterase, partial [Deltaproteobacteria bacterium]|nr:chemotaxis response regulator protein-glutamate methylesterase [Deltaproteobacteria bacterium]